MSRPAGSSNRKPSVHTLNSSKPGASSAITMMDKIYKANKERKAAEDERYNQLCSKVTVTKITTKVTKYKSNTVPDIITE